MFKVVIVLNCLVWYSSKIHCKMLSRLDAELLMRSRRQVLAARLQVRRIHFHVLNLPSILTIHPPKKMKISR